MPIRHKARKAHNQTVTTSALATIAALALLLVGAPAVNATPIPKVGGDLVINAPGRTQISFQHSPTGIHAGTPNEHQSRPGLSIVKMYIADYVFLHGTQRERGAAYDMLRTSNDNTATWLYGTYPNSINATAPTPTPLTPRHVPMASAKHSVQHTGATPARQPTTP